MGMNKLELCGYAVKKVLQFCSSAVLQLDPGRDCISVEGSRAVTQSFSHTVAMA